MLPTVTESLIAELLLWHTPGRGIRSASSQASGRASCAYTDGLHNRLCQPQCHHETDLRVLGKATARNDFLRHMRIYQTSLWTVTLRLFQTGCKVHAIDDAISLTPSPQVRCLCIASMIWPIPAATGGGRPKSTTRDQSSFTREGVPAGVEPSPMPDGGVIPADFDASAVPDAGVVSTDVGAPAEVLTSECRHRPAARGRRHLSGDFAAMPCSARHDW